MKDVAVVLVAVAILAPVSFLRYVFSKAIKPK
jgi:hypothetical protein